MRKWILAACALTTALATCGCQPSPSGGAASDPAPSAQTTSATPDGLKTVVLNAKGMH